MSRDKESKDKKRQPKKEREEPKGPPKENPKDPHDEPTDGAGFPVVGIGASAGGLEALKELAENLATDIKIACVVVQHLDPSHESLLAEILSKQTKMKVLQAKDGAEINVGHIYTIPPNTSLKVSDGRLHLAPRETSGGLFLPVNQLFESLAESYGHRAIGIVLSGTGSDGTEGVQAIKTCGGTTFVQDEQSAKFNSMPHSAIASGAADFVLPPREIAKHLGTLIVHPYWTDEKGAHPPSDMSAAATNEELKAIFRQVHKLEKIDFSSYKLSTVTRRILRRMAVKRVQTFANYAELLKADAAEVKALCNDLLIKVTKFFRDPDSFELLKTTIFPSIMNDRAEGDPIRVWVAGCSTGQEVYSILMSLVEYLSENDQDFPIQVFGTDINEAAVIKARSGIYAENAINELSRERLRRFFKKDGKTFEFSKTLRESVIFARHNILTDPPFARLDLLSCQNVLIYFDASLQRKVLPIFHYALKPSGFLILGPAESVGAAPELFDQVETGAPAYTKSQVVSRLHFDFGAAQQVAFRVTPPQTEELEADSVTIGLQVQRETDRLCMTEFAPPGVVFNEKLEVLHFRGRTGSYFEHSPGFATFDLLRMLKEGLISEVRSVIDKVKENGERLRKEGIRVRFNGDTHRVAIELFPVRIPSSKEHFFYLIFEDMDAPSYAAARKRRAAKRTTEGILSEAEQMSNLRNELASTKDYLQSINEQKEAANEELKAANEEIMSSNEELQSTNEELHTAKEELQSTNEELMTVNDELRIRNKDLSRLNDDQNNLFTSLNVAVVMLNRELRIRKFTPMAETLLRLIPSDVGRSILDIRPNVEIEDLESRLLEVIRTVAPMELEAAASDRKWYSVQIRPYRTSDDRIDGAIVLFSDITRIKTSLEYAEELEETIGQPLLFLAGDLNIKKANDRYYKAFQTRREDTEGRFLYDLGNGQWNIPKLRALLTDVLPKKTSFDDFEVTHDFPGIGKKTIRLNARHLHHHEPGLETILLMLEVLP